MKTSKEIKTIARNEKAIYEGHVMSLIENLVSSKTEDMAEDAVVCGELVIPRIYQPFFIIEAGYNQIEIQPKFGLKEAKRQLKKLGFHVGKSYVDDDNIVVEFRA